jgi:hypothetical protein
MITGQHFRFLAARQEFDLCDEYAVGGRDGVQLLKTERYEHFNRTGQIASTNEPTVVTVILKLKSR